MKEEDKFTPPKSNWEDNAHLVARAGISCIPIAGGPALEIFSAIVSPSLEKRRQKWMEDVAESLRKLEAEKSISLEDLQTNEQFITIVMQASQSAIRNHQQEKLSALRNAILNSALPNPPEESLQVMFLNFIDTFTVWHFKILELFQDPKAWADKHNHTFQRYNSAPLLMMIESAFPELENRKEFYDQIWRDLAGKGLVNLDTLNMTILEGGLLAPRISDLGNQFLKFITTPQ